MKIYTSYFYKIRFFTPNMIPISTAMWSPKWFNQCRGQNYLWVDKNNVINGIKAEPFVPYLDLPEEESCQKNCKFNPDSCKFLSAYSEMLDEIPIEDTLAWLEKVSTYARGRTDFSGEPIYVFIVHETPTNPCSERGPIQEYFHKNGIECTEWDG